MAKTSPAMFLKQVRMEIRKVTWPTRKETVVTSVMVSVVALIAAMFFLAADGLVAYGLAALLR